MNALTRAQIAHLTDFLGALKTVAIDREVEVIAVRIDIPADETAGNALVAIRGDGDGNNYRIAVLDEDDDSEF